MRAHAGILVFAISISLVVAGCASTAYWQGNQRLQRGDYQGATEALKRPKGSDSIEMTDLA